MELQQWGILLENPNHFSIRVGTDPRVRALLNLSGPQVAIFLAARRIMARDDTRATIEDETVNGGATVMNAAPLTYQRIHDEYTTSFVASGRYTISSDRYPSHVLHRACVDLMEMDLIRVRKERLGVGPLQYEHSDVLSAGTDIVNIPLFVHFEWYKEFLGPLKAGLLQCSTALREWGLKMN